MKVVMPQIGMTMIAGVIENWLVNDGDMVNKGKLSFDLDDIIDSIVDD